MGKRIVAAILGTLFVLMCVVGCGKTDQAPKQQAAAEKPKRDVIASQGVVAAAHPIAAQIGVDVLKKGGNAIDAAIATSFALGVVEPANSGIGGGGFAIVYVAKEKKSYVVDFRETAPAKAKPDMYKLDEKGLVINNASKVGYKAVAVPGHIRGMEMLLQKFGTMQWADLIQPSIQEAEKGLTVPSVLNRALTEDLGNVNNSPAKEWMHKVYYKGGLPSEIGDQVKNPELVQTLKKIASGGADVFYKGDIANAIVKEFTKPGAEEWITKEDLENYKPILREPVRGDYRGYTFVTLPPPSSGGVIMLEMLNILSGYDVAKMGAGSADFLQASIETQKLAFADRAKYMADPDFRKMPLVGLGSKEYAEERRSMIDLQKAKDNVKAGMPGKYESGNTTSFSVIDKEGNMVTITQTINDFLGACVVPEGTGILLNDEMDDFTPKPDSPNCPEAGKRPLSSMSPTIVLKDGNPFMTLGSPGATRILTAVTNTVINVLDFKMDIQSAIDAPRFHNTNSPQTWVESGLMTEEVAKALESRGQKFEVKQPMDLYFGGVHGIMILPDGKLHGGADSRRDGCAIGY